MKSFKSIITIMVLVFMLSSCSFFQRIFGGGGNKNGCPSGVNNVGAEKLMDGYKPKNKEEAKAIKKAKKAEMKAVKKTPYML